MSYLSQLRQSGLSLLNTLDGESLTYNPGDDEIQLLAVVNRDYDPRALIMKQPNFQKRNFARVEIQKSRLADAPETGKYFRDIYDQRLKIEKLTSTDLTWRCDCILSDVIEP